ncbi:hypothetical protein ABZS93_16200 [Streptomyces sp900116325]|uniref:hypothetical protein n=1 Tax=Streptomyces sp. 900116325 TaxID=3154295 RepID=UPI0033A3FDE4
MISEVVVALVSGGVGGAVTVYLARQKLRTEYRAEAAINQLLKHEEFKKRTFEAIKYRLPGFTDDELRKLLIRAGAVRLRSDRDERYGPYAEMWGLVKKNDDAIKKDDGPPALQPDAESDCPTCPWA